MSVGSGITSKSLIDLSINNIEWNAVKIILLKAPFFDGSAHIHLI
jgi:hypothetical protein